MIVNYFFLCSFVVEFSRLVLYKSISCPIEYFQYRSTQEVRAKNKKKIKEKKERKSLKKSSLLIQLLSYIFYFCSSLYRRMCFLLPIKE